METKITSRGQYHWYQVKAQIERRKETDGTEVVSELYLVNAKDFAEAQRLGYEEIAKSDSIIEGCDIVAVARKPYFDIIGKQEEMVSGDKWYKCKVALITLNERSGREIRKTAYFLTLANSPSSAHKRVDEFMRDYFSLHAYEVEMVEDTKILSVQEVVVNQQRD